MHELLGEEDKQSKNNENCKVDGSIQEGTGRLQQEVCCYILENKIIIESYYWSSYIIHSTNLFYQNIIIYIKIN